MPVKKRINRPKEQLRTIYDWLSAHPKGDMTHEQWAAAAQEATGFPVDKGLISRFMVRPTAKGKPGPKTGAKRGRKPGKNRFVARSGELLQSADEDKIIVREAIRGLLTLINRL